MILKITCDMLISKLSVLGKMATNMNIKEENDNPWDVTNIAEFLYYCCPECDTKVKTTHAFLEHAINAHQISSLIPLVEDPKTGEESSNF